MGLIKLAGNLPKRFYSHLKKGTREFVEAKGLATEFRHKAPEAQKKIIDYIKKLKN